MQKFKHIKYLTIQICPQLNLNEIVGSEPLKRSFSGSFLSKYQVDKISLCLRMFHQYFDSFKIQTQGRMQRLLPYLEKQKPKVPQEAAKSDWYDPPTITHPKQITEKVKKINGEESIKVYQRQELLGRGGFANCYITEQKETKRKAATKIINKIQLESFRTKLRLCNEIKLHKMLKHENVVEFYHSFEDQHNVYIFLELCQCGSLNDLLRSRNQLTTMEVQSFVYGICEGLKYLHSRKIIHRDMKLANVFLGEGYKIKIGDFGLAAKLEFGLEKKRTVCGTPNYIAPEVLSGKGYHYEVDIWAVGIIIYTLFFSVPPFQTDQAIKTYQKIRECDYTIPKNHKVPMEAIDLIRRTLSVSPADRPTLNEILESPFMRLGQGIPLSLPPIIDKRAPSKRDFNNIAFLEVREEKISIMEFENQSTAEKNKSNKSDLFKDDKIMNLESIRLYPCESSLKKQRITKIDEYEEGVFVFIIEDQGVCVYQKYSNIHYLMIPMTTNMVRRIEEVEKGTYQEVKISLSQCPYKGIMMLWNKQIGPLQNEVENVILVKKVQKYKNILTIKLTNQIIQMIFKENDGFYIECKKPSVWFFRKIDSRQEQIQLYTNEVLQASKENQEAVKKIQDRLKIKQKSTCLKKLSYVRGILEQTLGLRIKKRNQC